MSYDISLLDPVTKDVIELDKTHMMTGGTYAIGGTREAWLNITYNYSEWYYMEGIFPPTVPDENFHNGRGGIRSIYGMSGAESIPVLKHAIKVLEDCKEDISAEEREECKRNGATGYWMPTRRNAIKPLYQLLAFAQMRPDGVWEGD